MSVTKKDLILWVNDQIDSLNNVIEESESMGWGDICRSTRADLEHFRAIKKHLTRDTVL